jgi:hypothetical protein
MVYPVIQIESSDGGDQVRLTELSLSAVTDNPIGGRAVSVTVNVFMVEKAVVSEQYIFIPFKL